MEPVEPVVIIGVDVGQRSDPTAVVVAEQTPNRHGIRRLFVARHIERLPLGTTYPEVADRLAALYRNTTALLAARMAREDYLRGGYMKAADPAELWQLRAREAVWVLMDATGCGLPVVDFLRERAGIADGHLSAVMFTAGEGMTVHLGAREGTVGKSYLVSRLQALLASGRILLPETPEAHALTNELEDFELSVSAQANLQWAAKRGSHDDLVCALGLACLIDRDAYRCGTLRYA